MSNYYLGSVLVRTGCTSLFALGMIYKYTSSAHVFMCVTGGSRDGGVCTDRQAEPGWPLSRTGALGVDT